jgi:hypothetical protein
MSKVTGASSYWHFCAWQAMVATGEDFNVEEGEGKRPFRALLDVGLVALQLKTEFLVP